MSDPVFLGLTVNELSAFRNLLDELEIKHAKEFCRRVSVDGIPPQIERQIAYYEKKIKELKEQA